MSIWESGSVGKEAQGRVQRPRGQGGSWYPQEILPFPHICPPLSPSWGFLLPVPSEGGGGLPNPGGRRNPPADPASQRPLSGSERHGTRTLPPPLQPPMSYESCLPVVACSPLQPLPGAQGSVFVFVETHNVQINNNCLRNN